MHQYNNSRKQVPIVISQQHNVYVRSRSGVDMHERQNISLVAQSQGVQRGEGKQCVSTRRVSSEAGVSPKTGGVPTSTGRVEGIRCRAALGKVSCKETVAKTSKLMQCECELYDRE
jgi:hypothetical protein